MPAHGEHTRPVMPRAFLRTCVLLLLREQPSHGYELLDRLEALGLSRADPGGLYRTLRALERDGLVHSSWEASTDGPDRRIYQLTRAGTEELHRGAHTIARTRQAMDGFLSRYEEFVSVAPANPVVRAR